MWIVVDIPVAIVVFAVAHFFGGFDLAFAVRPHAAFATLDAFFALPFAAFAASTGLFGLTAVRHAFVDRTIAVVVFSVADLGFGFFRADALVPQTRNTTLYPFDTFAALDAAFPLFSVKTDAVFFVDLPVAVVVFPVVTDLSASRIDRRIVVIAVFVARKAVSVVVRFQALSVLADLFVGALAVVFALISLDAWRVVASREQRRQTDRKSVV